MDKTRFLKLVGFVSAIVTAIVSIVGGDYATGVGIAAAAFSSASVVESEVNP